MAGSAEGVGRGGNRGSGASCAAQGPAWAHRSSSKVLLTLRLGSVLLPPGRPYYFLLDFLSVIGLIMLTPQWNSHFMTCVFSPVNSQLSAPPAIECAWSVAGRPEVPGMVNSASLGVIQTVGSPSPLFPSSLFFAPRPRMQPLLCRRNQRKYRPHAQKLLGIPRWQPLSMKTGVLGLRTQCSWKNACLAPGSTPRTA